MRLAKYIAQQGYCSRRKAEELIAAGEVRVNGEAAVVTTPVDPIKDEVTIQGKALEREKKVYILLNKPPGILSTCKPGKEEGKAVIDLVPLPQRIYPVGRLDRDSRGLLLLTNDGELAYKLTHPSQEVEKEYLLTLDKPFSEIDIRRLREGVNIEGTLCRFKRVRKAGDRQYSVVITTGLKRQIRRMAEAAGRKTLDLQRIREGPLRLGKIPEGSWRRLNDREIAKLKGEL